MAKTKVKAVVRQVDAELALTWLARTEELGFHNRSLRKRAITRYARSMTGGHWELNGETIILDSKGALLNGQHRIYAVPEAFSDGGSVEMLVAEGVERDSYRTMDQGLHRNMTDILGVEGIADGNGLAALFRHIRVWEENRYRDRMAGSVMDNGEMADIARGNIEEWKSCLSYGKRLSREFGKPSSWAFVYWMFNEYFPDEAMDTFLIPLETGANLNEGHPILALRRKMAKGKADRANYVPKLIISMSVRAWNAVQEGRKLSSIHVPKLSDPIPKMVGKD